MEDLQKARKIRLSYSDPDATDSSSDEEEEPDNINRAQKISKRKFHETILEIKEKHSKILVSGSSYSSSSSSSSSTPEGIIQSGIGKRRTSGSYVGVHRRRSGRYSSEITDPFSKKRVWLGTFDTAEEAHLAYMSRKIKIRERLIARTKRGLISSRRRRVSAKQGSPSSVLHQTETKENNNNAVSRENNNNKAAAVSSSSEEEDERFGFLCGVQVVDRNGFLVGEYSKLDDLSICSEDGTFYCQDRVMVI